MYRCQITGKLSRLGDPRTGELYVISDSEKSDTKASEKLNRIVVKTRERVYTKWVRNDDKAESIDQALVMDTSEDGKWLEVFVARGWEIVREINASEEGVELWESWSPEEREVFLKHLDS